MWSIARLALNLSDTDFLRLTPRLYFTLSELHYERQKHIEWQTGVLASTVANFSMSRPEEALRPKDFPLPLLWEAKKRPRLNRKKVAAEIRAVFDVLKSRMQPPQSPNG
jgi:hypothetical protein